MKPDETLKFLDTVTMELIKMNKTIDELHAEAASPVTRRLLNKASLSSEDMLYWLRSLKDHVSKQTQGRS